MVISFVGFGLWPRSDFLILFVITDQILDMFSRAVILGHGDISNSLFSRFGHLTETYLDILV